MGLSQSLLYGFRWLYPHKDIVCPIGSSKTVVEEELQTIPQRKTPLCSLQKSHF